MKVELNKEEALFLANALGKFPGYEMQNTKPKELAAIEKAGRKLCTKFLKAIEPKKEPEGVEAAFEIEKAFISARGEFCGISPDEDL